MPPKIPCAVGKTDTHTIYTHTRVCVTETTTLCIYINLYSNFAILILYIYIYIKCGSFCQTYVHMYKEKCGQRRDEVWVGSKG